MPDKCVEYIQRVWEEFYLECPVAEFVLGAYLLLLAECTGEAAGAVRLAWTEG